MNTPLLCLAVAISLASMNVSAMDTEKECLEKALYFEAGIEDDIPMHAVGANIMWRVESPRYPNTICGVVKQCTWRGCQYAFMRDGKPETVNDKWKNYQKAVRVAKELLEGVRREFSGNPTNYVNIALIPVEDRVGWIKQCMSDAFLEKVGSHTFCDLG